MSEPGERVIAEVHKHRRERLRVLLRTHDGNVRCDLRLYVMASAGRWRPTKRGVTLDPARLDELIGALRLAQAEARKAYNGRTHPAPTSQN